MSEGDSQQSDLLVLVGNLKLFTYVYLRYPEIAVEFCCMHIWTVWIYALCIFLIDVAR